MFNCFLSHGIICSWQFRSFLQKFSLTFSYQPFCICNNLTLLRFVVTKNDINKPEKMQFGEGASYPVKISPSFVLAPNSIGRDSGRGKILIRAKEDRSYIDGFWSRENLYIEGRLSSLATISDWNQSFCVKFSTILTVAYSDLT